MPIDYKKYPPDWHAISHRVREGAGWKCEWCGAPNGVVITRVPGGYWSTNPDWEIGEPIWTGRDGQAYTTQKMCQAMGWKTEYGSEGDLLPVTRIWNVKVVLTVAHLGSNLAALCQACHSWEGRDDHKRNASPTRWRKRGQLSLEMEIA